MVHFLLRSKLECSKRIVNVRVVIIRVGKGNTFFVDVARQRTRESSGPWSFFATRAIIEGATAQLRFYGSSISYLITATRLYAFSIFALFPGNRDPRLLLSLPSAVSRQSVLARRLIYIFRASSVTEHSLRSFGKVS